MKLNDDYISPSIDIPLCFHDVIIDHLSQNHDKTAFYQLDDKGHEVQRVSYSELISRSLSISSKLLENNSKGDRCLILINPGIDFIIAFIGCLFAGIVAIPSIVPRKNKVNQRFWSVVYDSSPDCILTTEVVKKDLKKDITLLAYFKAIQNILCITDEPGFEGKLELPLVTLRDIAMLQYTSGSTEQPNGVVVSHKNLLHNSEVIKQSFNHDQDLVVATWLPPFHDMGLIGCILQPLYVGGSCVLIQPMDFIRNPSVWFKSITRYKATTTGCPNFALDYCVEKIQDNKDLDLSSLKVMFCGSEPVRKNSLLNFADKFHKYGFREEMFLPCYGLAESTLMVTGISQKDSPEYLNIDMHVFEHGQQISDSKRNYKTICITSCGKPWNDSNILIVDPDKQIVLDENMIGEIWVKGDSVASGYWNNEEKTKEVFKGQLRYGGSENYLRTGDLGFIRNDQLYISGRLKDLIIIRGMNIVSSDVENAINGCHPCLMPNSCAAFSVDKDSQEKLVVVAEVKRTFISELNEIEVFASIIECVAQNFNVPVHAIALISPLSIPKTSSGKIQRNECKRMFLNDELKVLATWKEDTKMNDKEITEDNFKHTIVSNWVKSWLSRKLNIDLDIIDESKPILSYGLDSIAAVELEKEINSKFGFDLFVGDFLENNSIKHLVDSALVSKELVE